jgi:hypothetical protein
MAYSWAKPAFNFIGMGSLFPRVKWPVSEDHLYLHPLPRIRMSVALPYHTIPYHTIPYHRPSRLTQCQIYFDLYSYLSSKQRVGLGIFLPWLNSPSGPRPPHCRGFVITPDTPHSVGLLWTSAMYADRPYSY